IHVFVTAMPGDAARPLHAELDEVHASLRAFRRRRDLVVRHDVAPIRPHELRAATARAAANELGERIAASREHAAAHGETAVRVLVDEYAVDGEQVRVVVTIVATGI